MMPIISKRFFLYLSGYNIKKSQNDLSNLKLLSQNSYWKNQIGKRDAIVKHHIDHNPWYYKFIGRDSQLGWNDLPIITKKDLQEFSLNKVDKKYFGRNYYFANTSGSSGHPLSFYKNKSCHSLSWAKIIESYKELGINESDLEARFFGHVMDSLKTQFLESLKDKLFNRIKFDVFDTSEKSLFKNYYKFKNNRFGYVYGYSNVIKELSKLVINHSLPTLKQICPSMKLCIVTAEMCSSEERSIMQDAFGVPVYREYGSSETSIIAIENKDFNWPVSTDRLWIEIVDENNQPVRDGGSGRIIITDLYNNAFPFIRYEIGDIGAIKKTNKYPFMFLKELHGRVSDQIHLPSGKIAPGLTFYYVARSIIERTNNITEFRIIQKEIDRFRFLIASKQDLSEDDKVEIYKATEKYLEKGLKIEFEKCENLKKEYSNKIQHFFSEINVKRTN